MAKGKGEKKIPVDNLKHKDRRTNIPTEELRNFVKDDEIKPKSIEYEGLLYSRDTSLDPQLVWKGKDKQDREPLKVPSVPVYIQEKIHPRFIIENIRKHSKKNEYEAQADLFGDFNGIKFEDMVEFYQHDMKWSNRMILGDSLLVMNSLAEKEGLKGKVQMIYMDPPYGIRFGSNWQVSTRKHDIKDRAEDTTRQPEQIRAFRDTWEMGVHSYLSYLRDRLTVSRELLTETGSVFVQIGNENVHLVRCLLDEVFGSENFMSLISFRTKIPLGTKYLAGIADYIIWYAKKIDVVKYRKLFSTRLSGGDTQFTWIESPDGKRRRMSNEEKEDPMLLPKGSRPFRLTDLVSAGRTETCVFDFKFEGKSYFPSGGKSWKTNKDGIEKLISARRIMVSGDTPSYVFFQDDYPVQEMSNLWIDTQGAADKSYVVQTSEKVIQRCLLMTTDPGDLVIDPTCGSGTTAFVAEQWGRRWITTDTSRVALALARTRLMGAKHPYYLLEDSAQGILKECELKSIAPPMPIPKTENDIKKGFVYERVPHITLGAVVSGISNDYEYIYDKPYEDKKVVRVTGPFTVESLSPHRVLATDAILPLTEIDGKKQSVVGQFENMIIENLRKAGIQGTKKDQRFKFDHLEPFSGLWIHAVGEYKEKGGQICRVAISIGPEHGTVGRTQVTESAKEAMKGAGFDLLIICGFAFDAMAGETVKELTPDKQKPGEFAMAEAMKQYGKLPILLARMNPDLAMGDELLKNTGAGNLFMVFGEPDVNIKKTKDGKLTVKVNGVDVYDPTTGEVRSNTTDDIACWFIDTDYNGESFFVRHAYFTGAEEPYDKLKRALRSEIDESAWSALYKTESRPFERPDTGKIAIKVINHYGDEVLKVYEVKK